MQFDFRPLGRDDFDLLARWLADVEVARWWCHETTPEARERDFGAVADGTEPGEDLVVSLDGEPIGLVQRCRADDYPDDLADFTSLLGSVPPEARCLDYLIGAAARRSRGIGTAILAAVAADTFARYRETDCLLVSVVAANRRSWRACEKAGFRIVASGDLTPDNPIDPPRHHVLRLDRPT